MPASGRLLSIIVPAFNEEKLLPQTLQSLKSACSVVEERGWSYEIIVCDNNSTDATGEIARQSGAKVVFEPVNQIARSRNSGAAAAAGDWFLFIDADSELTPGLLGETLDAMVQPDIIGGGSTICLDSSELLPRILSFCWNSYSRLRTLMAGSYIFCCAQAFKLAGGFPLEYFVAEELYFALRLKEVARQQGKRLVILHRHPLKTSARKMKLYSKTDFLRLLLRAAKTRGKAWQQREACHPWYDGRR